MMTRGWHYAHDVVKGEIPASQWVIKACQRAIDDNNREDSPWKFYQSAADHIINFCNEVPHVKGITAGQPFKPEGWQCFVLEQLYGWRRESNPLERRYREAVVEVARKNGKSYICSVLALYELLFTEDSPEIYSVATKRDQAKIVWESARQISKKMDERFASQLKSTTSAVSSLKTFGTYKFVGRDSDTLDGLNPSLAIIDEAAAIPDRNLIEVFESATGSRLNPLIVYITTAQFTKATAYYDKRNYLKTILNGESEDDRFFGVLYALEEDEDWQDPKTWIKANPNLGVSQQIETIDRQVNQALAIPSKKNEVLIKHFNIYTTGSGKWLDTHHWENSKGDVDRTGKCYLGVDLSDKNDLTAVVRMWLNGSKASIDVQCWVSEQAYKAAPKHIWPVYQAAKDSGILQVSPGELVDHREVQAYIEKSAKDYNVVGVGYDPYHANTIANELEDLGINVMEVRQSIGHISPAVYEAERLITEERIVHEGNPFTLWQLGNAELHIGLNDDKKIRKGEDPTLKIDFVIALLMCTSMVGKLEEPANFNFHFMEYN